MQIRRGMRCSRIVDHGPGKGQGRAFLQAALGSLPNRFSGWGHIEQAIRPTTRPAAWGSGHLDRRPALIARCLGVADDSWRPSPSPASMICWIAISHGAHHAAGYGTCDGGLVIDLSRMKGMNLCGRYRLGRVGGVLDTALDISAILGPRLYLCDPLFFSRTLTPLGSVFFGRPSFSVALGFATTAQTGDTPLQPLAIGQQRSQITCLLDDLAQETHGFF